LTGGTNDEGATRSRIEHADDARLSLLLALEIAFAAGRPQIDAGLRAFSPADHYMMLPAVRSHMHRREIGRLEIRSYPPLL
jgi:hypothetical protein